ncbi:TPA: hypothetical protein DDW35_04425 [Candidatus Sumerlaeota bacterium]|jgi:hypothetical protein|nr:hypothetical protein [Candidatus Sumerlaeota bacterium]
MNQQTPFEREPFPSTSEKFPPWENMGFERWWTTVKGMFVAPSDFFSRMAISGGLGRPLIFGVIGGSVGGIIAQAYSLISSCVTNQQTGQFLIQVALIFLMPLLMILSLFLCSGTTHLLLKLVGGARYNYETTFRVYAYLTGSLGLLGVIPFCATLLCLTWGTIVEIIGISKAHQISIGKAIFAVLIPTLSCWGCLAAMVGSEQGLGGIIKLFLF